MKRSPVTPSSRLAAVLLALGLAAGAALAAPTSTKFDPAMDVQGTKLQLNGAGTRYRAIFKVYDMGLYTAKKVSTSPRGLLRCGTSGVCRRVTRVPAATCPCLMVCPPDVQRFRCSSPAS